MFIFLKYKIHFSFFLLLFYLAVDGIGAVLVMTTEDQLICFVGMAKKESGDNMKLALSLVKERYVKKGEKVPNLNILDDLCCKSPLAAGSSEDEIRMFSQQIAVNVD